MPAKFALTLDEETKKYLNSVYEELGGAILEFGSGGSTFLALKNNPLNVVYCCETDSAWLCRLMLEVAEQDYLERVVPIHLDIGKTTTWGNPDIIEEAVTKERIQKFITCPLTPWKILERQKVEPDFVFIDGRWRASSFLASMIFAKKKIRVLWDDCKGRSYYHVFGDIISPTMMIGRAALFDAVFVFKFNCFMSP